MIYKGLIYKDLFLLKEAFPIVALAVLFLLFTIIFGFSGGFLALLIMLLVFAVKVVESTLIYDETDQWDSFVLTTPMSRKDVVRSKYLLQVIFLVSTFLICLAVFTAVTNLLPALYGNSWILTMTAIGFCYALVYGAIVIPIYLKFGAHTSRYISFGLLVLAAGAFGVTLGVGMYLEFEFSASVIPHLIAVIAGSLAVYGISYGISQRIYAKKEY